MALKDLTFQNIGKSVKTFFTGKELTPEQKEREKEKKAYQQILSEKEKETMKYAYQQELLRQRQIYAKEKEKEAMQKGMAMAKQDVYQQNKPKEKFAWLTAPARAIQKYMPAPSQAFQNQMLGNLGTSGKKQQSNAGMWDINLGTPAMPFSAQAISHKIREHHKTHHHLKHLGTAKGGVSVRINGTEIVLSNPKTKVTKAHHLRHHILKKKIKQTNPINDLIWKY